MAKNTVGDKSRRGRIAHFIASSRRPRFCLPQPSIRGIRPDKLLVWQFLAEKEAEIAPALNRIGLEVMPRPSLFFLKWDYNVQRVRKFVVNFSPKGNLNLKPRGIRGAEAVNLDSWHKACDLMLERLAENRELVAEVTPAKCNKVIARFCSESLAEIAFEKLGLNAEETVPLDKTVWRSVRLSSDDQQPIFENRNIRDFHWDQLDGAKRDSPYELTSVERAASRNGLVGFLYSLVRQYIDLFRRPV